MNRIFFSSLPKNMGKVPRTLVTKSPVIVTPKAWDRMSNIIKSQEAFCFHLDIKSGGCSGFSYDMKLLNFLKYCDMTEKYKLNHLIEEGEARLFIEPTAEMYLIGTTIDYESEDFEKGRFESKFTFTPDKDFATSCGCGVSFNPKI